MLPRGFGCSRDSDVEGGPVGHRRAVLHTREALRCGYPLWLFPVVVLWLILQASLATALGEEIGWRVYLLPRLEYLGTWGAVLLTGLLHGIWHLPVIFLTNLYHADGNTLIVVLLFLASVVIAGVFLGYLRLRTGSVWPAVIGHAAHNVLWSVFGVFTATSSPVVNEYLVGDSGILIALGYAALGGRLMYIMTKKDSPHVAPKSPEAAAESA